METEYTDENNDSFLSEGGEADALRKKLDTLVDELAVCRKEKDEYLVGWQRCQADATNARNEEEKKRQEYAQFASQHVLEELVAIKIMFDHAFSGADENPYTRGFRNIYAQFAELLSRNGMESIEARGKPFDAALHEAIESVLVDEKEKDHMVVEEVEKGYMMHGKVIRPSKVKVGEFKN